MNRIRTRLAGPRVTIVRLALAFMRREMILPEEAALVGGRLAGRASAGW